MKILWQAHEGNISGANFCLLENLRILQDEGFEQHVTIPGDGSMKKRIDEMNIPVTIVKMYGWTQTLSEKKTLTHKIRTAVRSKLAIAETERIITTIKPDFVATNTNTNPIAAYAALNKGVKHVWFIHEFGEEDHGYRIAGDSNKGKKIINKLSQKVVFNSEVTQQFYQDFIDASKRFIVPYSIDLPSVKIRQRPSEGRLRLVMLGQIAPSKNQLHALKALNICLENGLDVELNIIGKAEDKSYLHELEILIKDQHLSQNVHFLGSSDNPKTLLIHNDALLMCSRMEAFGRVTVEALKCGVPVIGANAGGTCELINHNVNGLLYEQGNYHDLALKISEFYDQRSLFDSNQIAAQIENRFNSSITKQQLLTVFT